MPCATITQIVALISRERSSRRCSTSGSSTSRLPSGRMWTGGLGLGRRFLPGRGRRLRGVAVLLMSVMLYATIIGAGATLPQGRYLLRKREAEGAPGRSLCLSFSQENYQLLM